MDTDDYRQPAIGPSTSDIEQHAPTVYRVLDRVPRDIRNAVNACYRGDAPWPLTLSGPSGLGKTCAGLLLTDYRGGVGWTWYGLACEQCEEMRRIKLSADRTADYWARWTRYRVCVIDEIGQRGTSTEHQRETLQFALDKRTGMPLVLISNIDLAALSSVYDERIGSRLAGGTFLSADGPDQRTATWKPEHKAAAKLFE